MSDRQVNDPRIDLEVVLNRKKVVDALRSGEHTQLFSALGNWKDPAARTCWMGVVFRVLGTTRDPTRELGLKLGLNSHQWRYFVNQNDAGRRFPELATMMEELPPPLISVD